MNRDNITEENTLKSTVQMKNGGRKRSGRCREGEVCSGRGKPQEGVREESRERERDE